MSTKSIGWNASDRVPLAPTEQVHSRTGTGEAPEAMVEEAVPTLAETICLSLRAKLSQSLVREKEATHNLARTTASHTALMGKLEG